MKKLQRTSKMKPFIKNYNWDRINYSSGKTTSKSLRRIIQQLLLVCYMKKKKKYVFPIMPNKVCENEDF